MDDMLDVLHIKLKDSHGVRLERYAFLVPK